jgi:hypothetical protein
LIASYLQFTSHLRHNKIVFCFEQILVFWNDRALIQNIKIVKLKFRFPHQRNQITNEDRKLFDISDKFFQICELLDEYAISLNDTTKNPIRIL